MTKKYLIIIIFALILVIIIGFQVLNRPNENQGPQISNLGARTNNEGAVEITVTPKKLSDKEWAFEMTLNTHSVDIGEDLTKASVLINENGNEYNPIEWQGDPPGGHHRSGILKFNSISPRPTLITLKIRQVDGIEERNFTWQLK